MKRKITILTIAFLSSMLMYANAFAAATGRCGDSITWTLDDSGNLTLSGSGEMWNNGYDDSPFKDYEIRKATVKYGITSIGESTFLGCRGMTELTLPNSVTSIGDFAFEGCSGLTELTLPNSVRSIGNCAFSLCRGLTELTLPNSVTSIGDCAFYGCSGLTELTLPNGVMSIGGNAFEGCSGLTELTLPNGVTSIGDGAFSGCRGLTELILPNSVTSIADDAFHGCTGLTELTLPNSVTSIGDGAFRGCTGLTELILPNSVTSIGESAFSGCSGLEKIAVESGNSCYDSRDNCNSIIDTETNTLIVGCKNSVIPNSVTSIGDGAFICCSDLEKITSLAEIPPVCGSGVFDRVNKTNCELIVPVISVTAYKLAEVWNEFSNIRGFSGVEAPWQARHGR